MTTQTLAAGRAIPRIQLRAALGLLLGLSGCGMMSSSPASLPLRTTSVPVQVARPADPLADFAATARVGQQGMAGNPPAPVQLVRSYNSGGGRPCRELLVGGMNTGRQALYCEDTSGQWTAVRPLLQNGTPIRP